eukprot:4249424-Pleurochrysis_carterae.AAC.1
MAVGDGYFIDAQNSGKSNWTRVYAGGLGRISDHHSDGSCWQRALASAFTLLMMSICCVIRRSPCSVLCR